MQEQLQRKQASHGVRTPEKRGAGEDAQLRFGTGYSGKSDAEEGSWRRHAGGSTPQAFMPAHGYRLN